MLSRQPPDTAALRQEIDPPTERHQGALPLDDST